MKLYDIKTKAEISPTGRRTTPKKRAHQPVEDLNPIKWSKWLYEILVFGLLP